MWSISWLVGAGARDLAGSRLRFLAGVVNKLAGGCGCAGTCWSRLRYLVLGYVIWLVVVRVCGFAGARVCGF